MSDSDAAWSAVDAHLFRGERLRALMVLRELHGFSLQRALETMAERLTFLKATAADRFEVPDEEWGEFYS